MHAAVSAVFPRRCAVCQTGSSELCRGCWGRLQAAPVMLSPAGIDWCGALLAYDGAGRTLLARLKYRNERGAIVWLATGMADLVRSAPLGDPYAAVTWAPTSAVRRRSRGFDQAELLARAISRELDLPCRSLLVRAPGPPQTGRTRHDRLDGPTFDLVGTGRTPPAVLLIDDVITTGTTVSSAATVLRSAGVGRVDVVAAATTLLKNSPG